MANKKTVIYPKNYLDNVILRLDFDKVDLSKLSLFSKKLSTEFPFQEPKNGIEGKLHIDLKKNLVNNQREEVVFWEYFDAFKNKKIKIASNHLIIEYLNRSYKNADILTRDCEGVVQTFLTDFGVQSITRIGLRYVNRFDLDTSVQGKIDWKKYFSPELVSGISFSHKLKYPYARAMSQLYFKLKECDILVSYGIWNQDFPNQNVSKEFILDIDCFSRFPLETTSEIKETVKLYNKNIQHVFEKSIKSEIIKLMKDE